MAVKPEKLSISIKIFALLACPLLVRGLINRHSILGELVVMMFIAIRASWGWFLWVHRGSVASDGALLSLSARNSGEFIQNQSLCWKILWALLCTGGFSHVLWKFFSCSRFLGRKHTQRSDLYKHHSKAETVRAVKQNTSYGLHWMAEQKKGPQCTC